MKLEERIEEIQLYGSLGYSADQIADAWELTTSSRALLSDRLSSPNDVLAIAYRKGFIIAERETDVTLQELAKAGNDTAIELQAERSKQRRIRELKKAMFGV